MPRDRIIYLAFDESGYGNNMGYLECYAGVSSITPKDAEPVKMRSKHRMKVEEIVKFLSASGRDYRTVHASPDKFDKGSPRLIQASSLLITELLLGKEGNFGLELLFDGIEMSANAREMEADINENLKSAEVTIERVSFFPKSRTDGGDGNGKGYYYPRLLVVADSLAAFCYQRHRIESALKLNEKVICLG